MKTAQFLQDNDLIEHDLLQGSPEWDEFRLNHDGASEAPVMLGDSKLATRTELLDAKATGIAKEFSAFVKERIFTNGHMVEALARPMIEQKFGIQLYPVVYSRGRLSASCDGITMAGNIGWEHKQWNEKLAAAVAAGELPDSHMAQPQQCLLITGAEKWIFTVSDGTPEKMVSMEILPDPTWFERILAGWEQFNKERTTHQPRNIKEMPKAEAIVDLPALFAHAKGVITEHNMDEFGAALTVRLAETRAIVLVTDQDFSNAKEHAKKFRDTAKAIKLTKEQMLAQAETIGEAARKMDSWIEDLNKTALQLEKDVEREDKAKKEAMIYKARVDLAEHIAALENQIKPIRLALPATDFALAIKGKSKYANMQDAIDTMLAGAIIAADQAATAVRIKLDWCKENAAGHESLYPDLQQLITKPLEDFALIIGTRIKEFHEKEQAKLDAERQRIEAEVKAKAEREAAEKLAHDAANIRAEERAKVEAENRAKAVTPAPADIFYTSDATGDEFPASQRGMVNAKAVTRPTRSDIIKLVADTYSMSIPAAHALIRAEFAEVAA